MDNQAHAIPRRNAIPVVKRYRPNCRNLGDIRGISYLLYRVGSISQHSNAMFGHLVYDGRTNSSVCTSQPDCQSSPTNARRAAGLVWPSRTHCRFSLPDSEGPNWQYEAFRPTDWTIRSAGSSSILMMPDGHAANKAAMCSLTI